MSAREVEDFLKSPCAEAAVRLRRWDDEAKIDGLSVPGLDHYQPCIDATIRQPTAPGTPSPNHEK